MNLNCKKLKQIGVVVCGGGLNIENWIIDLKNRGYTIRRCNGYIEYYK